jgi:hypothetical protein
VGHHQRKNLLPDLLTAPVVLERSVFNDKGRRWLLLL